MPQLSRSRFSNAPPVLGEPAALDTPSVYGMDRSSLACRRYLATERLKVLDADLPALSAIDNVMR